MLIPGIDDRVTFSVLSALVVFALGRLAERFKAKDQERHSAKAVALPLLTIAEALEKHCRMLDDALSRNGELLRAYYKFVAELVPQADLDEFGAQVGGSARLPHNVLADLRSAHQSTARASSRHDQIRQTLEMSTPGAPEGEAYRRLLFSARDAVRNGLRRLEDLGPTDTRRAIANFMRESQ